MKKLCYILFVLICLPWLQVKAQCTLPVPANFTTHTALTTCSSFTVSWQTVPGATRLEIEYDTDPNFGSSSTQPIIIGPTNPITVSGLSPANYYYYRLRSYNNTCGYSAPSFTATVSMGSIPAGFLISALTCNTATIQYISNQPNITHHVFKNVSTGATFSDPFMGGSGWVFSTIPGLLPNTSYTYTVTAYTSNGCALVSNPFSFTTLPEPLPPTALSAVNITCADFRAQWNAVSGATGYYVDVATSPAFGSTSMVYNNFPISNGSTTHFDFTGLNPQTDYYYRIKTEGNGCISANSNTIALYTAPDIPVTLAAANITCTTFRAQWNPVNGVTGYYVDVATSTNFGPDIVPPYNNYFVPGSNNFLDVVILNPGTTYFYRVRSELGCTSLNSSTEIVVTDNLVPPIPVNVHSITCSEATLDWTSVASSYDITIREQATGLVVATSPSSGSFNATSLNPGTTYEYVIDAYKFPDCSSQTTGTFTTDPLPAFPSGFTATQQSCSSAQVSWSAIPGASGYYIEVATSLGFSPLLSAFFTNNTYQDITGLTVNMPYYFRVLTITHLSCSSAFSTAGNIVLVTPDPPVFNMGMVGCTDANISWASSHPDVRLQVAEDPGFAMMIFDQWMNSNSYTVPNLKPGTNYYVRMAAMEPPSCIGIFSNVAIFMTTMPSSGISSGGLMQNGTYYETCAPITAQIGGTGDCINAWFVEIQYYSDNTFSSRPMGGNMLYEWTSPLLLSPLPAAFDPGGLSDFVINNGGQTYPSNMLFQPDGYYRIILHTGVDYNGNLMLLYKHHLDLHVCHFTVNGDPTQGPIQVCQGDPIFAQASAMAGNFDMTVEEFDANGNPTSPPQTLPIPPATMMSGFDIIPYFSSYSFAGGNSYKVTLNSANVYISDKMIQVNAPVSSFVLNGSNTSPLMICSTASLTLDGSTSICHLNQFELGIAECDAAGNLLTSWTTGSVASTSISNLDVLAFATGLGKTLLAGKYYKLAWGVASPMVYSYQIVYIYPTSATANAGQDLITCGNAVTLTGNTSSYGTVQWTILSGSGGAFSNATAASNTFTPTAGNIYTLRYTITTPCGSSYDDLIVYADAIPYLHPDVAYKFEGCMGNRRICMTGGQEYSYTWDAVNLQYIRVTANGSTMVLIPMHFSTQYEADRSQLPGFGNIKFTGSNQMYSWDNDIIANRPGITLPSDYNYSNNDHIWDQDHLFVIATPMQPWTLTEYVDVNSLFNTPTSMYNIVSPFYAPTFGVPYVMASGTYNMATTPAIINPGNIDLDPAPDYLLQQDRSVSGCAAFGPRWRLATKTEMGVTESMANSQLMHLDEAYVGGQSILYNTKLLSSSVDGSIPPATWTFAPTGQFANNRPLYKAEWKSGYYPTWFDHGVHCVFKSNPPCSGLNKTGQDEEPYDGESVSGTLPVTDQVLSPAQAAKKSAQTAPTEISFIPNPTSDFAIFNASSEEVYQYELIDIQGRSLQQGTLLNGSRIPLKEYDTGIYLVRLFSADKTYIRSMRLIKN